MKLYLLRHGVAAEPDRRNYPDDAARPLTPKGKKKLRRIAEYMAAMEMACDALLTSPLPRAVQTAEIAAGGLKLKKGLLLAPELAPDGDPKALIDRLNRDFQAAEAIMLVGHEPGLSQLISVLLTGRVTGVPLELKKGGLCRLRIESLRYGQCAVLESLLAPKDLRSLKAEG